MCIYIYICTYIHTYIYTYKTTLTSNCSQRCESARVARVRWRDARVAPPREHCCFCQRGFWF